MSISRASPQPLLEIKHLSVDYRAESGTVHALTDVSLRLERGQILGLAGESGSGKLDAWLRHHATAQAAGGDHQR